MRNFGDLLTTQWNTKDTLLCIGLDPDYSKIPETIKQSYNSPGEQIFEFNKAIIDQTHDLVCCFKPQYAFYSAQGIDGIEALKKTIDYIRNSYSDIPVLIDVKRGDIGNTAESYAQEAYDFFEADAATVNPYMGFDSIEPFVKRRDKGTVILCRTSNNSAVDFQDINEKETGIPLYQLVAKKAVEWNTNQNISLVVGATYPEEMKIIREIVGDEIPFLIPGLGSQGGKAEDLVHGFNKDKTGIIASASRSIIFAGNDEDFAEKAREVATALREEINRYR